VNQENHKHSLGRALWRRSHRHVRLPRRSLSSRSLGK